VACRTSSPPGRSPTTQKARCCHGRSAPPSGDRPRPVGAPRTRWDLRPIATAHENIAATGRGIDDVHSGDTAGGDQHAAEGRPEDPGQRLDPEVNASPGRSSSTPEQPREIAARHRVERLRTRRADSRSTNTAAPGDARLGDGEQGGPETITADLRRSPAGGAGRAVGERAADQRDDVIRPELECAEQTDERRRNATAEDLVRSATSDGLVPRLRRSAEGERAEPRHARIGRDVERPPSATDRASPHDLVSGSGSDRRDSAGEPHERW